MARTITVLSPKGGTGKTTVARTLADADGRVGLTLILLLLSRLGGVDEQRARFAALRAELVPA